LCTNDIDPLTIWPSLKQKGEQPGMMPETKVINTDVLVIGGGGAGAMAAIKALAEGDEVLVVTKGPFPSGNTSIALWGCSVSLGHADPRDNPQVHFDDTVTGGNGLNHRKMVRAWVTEIVELTKEMDRWGIDLIREGDKFSQSPWPGHTYPRMVHHHNNTGRAVTQCLGKKSKEIGVPVIEHTIVGGLLKKDDAVAGAWGIQYQTGQLLFIQAKAVILATGGMGHLFPRTDNVRTVTGEGYTLAFRAGAELTEMEMCRFILSICYPEKMTLAAGFRAPVDFHLISHLLNREARLYNGLEERVYGKKHPDTEERGRGNEQLIRDIGFEICEGRGRVHGGVYLDVSDVPPEMQKKDFAVLWDTAARIGVDLSYQPIEVAPHPHDFIGGVRIDETTRTGVPGLFAAGRLPAVRMAQQDGRTGSIEALALEPSPERNASSYSNSWKPCLGMSGGGVRDKIEIGCRKERHSAICIEEAFKRADKYLGIVRGKD
jgi:fumarate reductase (CoM/CoB) subunit A